MRDTRLPIEVDLVFEVMTCIGPCDYEHELVTLSAVPALTAESSVADLFAERLIQLGMLDSQPVTEHLQDWSVDDDRPEPPQA
jgi:hypothetical protein